jgi:hypothetical protein
VSVIRDVPKVVVPPVPPVPGVVPDPPPPPPPPIVKSLIHFTPAGVVYVPVPEVNRCTVGAVAVTGLVTVIFGVVPPEDAAPPEAVTEVTVPLPVPQVGQEITGAAPPELTIGPVAVTPVTVPQAAPVLAIKPEMPGDPSIHCPPTRGKLPINVALPGYIWEVAGIGVVPNGAYITIKPKVVAFATEFWTNPEIVLLWALVVIVKGVPCSK